MRKLVCYKCRGTNINVQIVTTDSKTKKRSMGCLWSIGRFILIICTCGLWLIIGRRIGTDRTKMKSKKIAVCQSCGYSWNI